MKLLSNMNAPFNQTPAEVNNLPSETVPDQSLSIAEIISRFASGKPLPQSSVYYTDEDLPDINTLDLTEIHELKQNLQSNIAENQNKLRKAKKESDDRKAEEATLKRISERQKKEETPTKKEETPK